jgi:hypothetical protein
MSGAQLLGLLGPTTPGIGKRGSNLIAAVAVDGHDPLGTDRPRRAQDVGEQWLSGQGMEHLRKG